MSFEVFEHLNENDKVVRFLEISRSKKRVCFAKKSRFWRPRRAQQHVQGNHGKVGLEAYGSRQNGLRESFGADLGPLSPPAAANRLLLRALTAAIE